MNYRHAFHAGNFADCMKHALLVWLLRALQRKPAPLFVLDTHAGAGRYDLDEGPAARTGEWRKGIARLLDDPPPPLADYVGLVRSLGLYPGSPALIRALLRPDDRLACCELHPEDAAALRRLFRPRSQVGGAPARRLGGARRAAAAEGTARAGADRSAVRGPAGIRRLAAGLATGHARVPHRRVRRLVSDQAPRAGARLLHRCCRRPACATSSPPNSVCASRSIRRG